MNYKIKWIEENLGITRNMIRRYEKEGLLPENREGRDREFTEEDLSKLWKIRIFLKIGFSLAEIREFLKDESGLEHILNRKIRELEKKKEEIDQQLNSLKVMDTTGKLPSAFTQSYTKFEKVYHLASQQYQNPMELKVENFWENLEAILSLHKLLEIDRNKKQEINESLNDLYRWFQNNKVVCSKKIFAENFASHMQDAFYIHLFGEDNCRYLKEVFLSFGKIERRD